MIYPDNFEKKIGFDEIRTLLKGRCISTLGTEWVDNKLTFMKDFDLIKTNLMEAKEMDRFLTEEDDCDIELNFFDIRQALMRIKPERTHMEELELFDLKRALKTIVDFTDVLDKGSDEDEEEEEGDNDDASKEASTRYPALKAMMSDVKTFPLLIKRIESVLNKYGKVKDTASNELLTIRHSLEQTVRGISHSLRSIISEAQNEGYIERDVSPTLRDGRLVIPVAPALKRKIKGIIHDESATGKTVFIEPTAVVEANNRIRELKAAERREIIRILQELTTEVRPHIQDIMFSQIVLGHIDYLRALSAFSNTFKAIFPTLVPHPMLSLSQAYHPLLQQSLEKHGKKMVPLDVTLPKNKKILLISGPNAGGKSVCLKTVGLLQYMIQCGMPIPVKENSVVGIFDDIFIDIGDEQSIQDNLSTFSSYITQLVSFLPSAGPRDLVLLDELGSGTDPVEGAALAQSVTEYLQMEGAPAIITSHFSEMKKLAYETKGIENAFVEFDEKTLAPTYRLIIGVAGNSNAFNICRRFGMPDMILGRAIQLKNESPLHNMEEVMERLNQQSRDLNKEKDRVDKTLHQAEELKNSLEDARDEFYRRKDSILEKAREEAENMKRDLRVQSETIIKDLKKNAAALNKNKLGDKISDIRGRIDGLAVQGRENRRDPLPQDKIRKGTYVYIDTIDSEGTIVSVSRNQVSVQCGLIQVKVTPEHLFKAKKPKKQEKILPYAHKKTMTRSVAQVHTELNIIGKTVDEAIPEVDRFLNDCFMAGISPVRIIHGKGTGSLRRGVQDYLRTLNFVTDFHEADPTNGGAGVTEVYF